jgi:AraC family transcriptional regulator, positive regulator of tynA and feaB
VHDGRERVTPAGGKRGISVTVVFDAATLAPRERLEALNAAIARTDIPQEIRCGDGVLGAHRIEFHQLGLGASLMRNSGSCLLVNRTAHHVRMSAPEIVSMGLMVRGRARLSTAYTERPIEQGHLTLVNTARPYSLAQDCTGQPEHVSLMMDLERLGLPLDVVHAAAPALCSSPLYELVRNHFAQLSRLSADLPEPAQGRLGWATVQLVRSLVTTAAGDARGAGALHDSLVVRVKSFIDDHLGDPGIGPDEIAAAHHISVRHLYTQWSRGGEPGALAEWIMGRRLDRARGRLADPDCAELAIGAVARESGFVNMTHFSRRFRQAYGISPREWRAQARNRTKETGHHAHF